MTTTMSKTLRTMLGTALVAGAFGIFGGEAAASPSDYRAGMRELMPQADQWIAELTMTADAALTKPEVACGAQMAELALRGASIAADLEGTGQNAPRPLAAAHTQATRSVAHMAVAARAACGNPAGTVGVIASESAGYSASMLRINVFVARSYASGR
ncbi:hypothetical protein DCC79_06270 [bacterium]|nr:hypothetical protein [Chloroflexi bacterium CFX6]RIL10992.1 MAG: hypothetical protein DCC79_06270 [bacterium]